MDSLLEKFYNGGNLQSRNGFTRFSALQTNPSLNIGLAPATKSPLPVRPLISTVNSTNLNINHKPNLTINTNFNNLVTNKDFLKPQNLAFNSSSDLLYNNPGYTHKRYNSEYNIRNNTVADIKRNDTKMQMMEEKMKNLELKSQRLEVINDFFFDMFENNLVKDELTSYPSSLNFCFCIFAAFSLCLFISSFTKLFSNMSKKKSLITSNL